MNEKDNNELEEYMKQLESRMWKGLVIGCIVILLVILIAGICYR